jgi:hypothetical protein
LFLPIYKEKQKSHLLNKPSALLREFSGFKNDVILQIHKILLPVNRVIIKKENFDQARNLLTCQERPEPNTSEIQTKPTTQRQSIPKPTRRGEQLIQSNSSKG